MILARHRSERATDKKYMMGTQADSPMLIIYKGSTLVHMQLAFVQT
jgi:hypothetical protein